MKRALTAETTKYVGRKVKVCGWVNTRRDHGKISFIDLRDISGILQVVFPQKTAKKLRPEWVVCVEGEIKKRPNGMQNPKLNTGKIELQAEKMEILSEAKTLPFSVETPEKLPAESGFFGSGNSRFDKIHARGRQGFFGACPPAAREILCSSPKPPAI